MTFSKAEQKRIIRVALRKQILKSRKLKLRDFGDPANVSKVIHEERTTPHLRRRIAKAAGIPYRDFWANAA